MKLNLNKEKAEKFFVLFGMFMFVFLLFFNAWMTHKYYFNFLRSDDSSELVYARLLAKEGGIISSNWHGSTELEILNTQLVTSLMFHFTSDFQLVRILSQMILAMILEGCYLFCLRGIDKKKAFSRFWKTAFLLLIPISDSWVFFILKAYYVPALCVCFLSVGLALRITKRNLNRKQRICLTVAGCVLAFVSSLEGVRHLELTFLPLMLTFVWIWWNENEKCKWTKKLFSLPQGMIESVLWLCAGFAGYLTDILVLAKRYTYAADRPLQFPDIITAENFQNMVNAILEVMGYAGERKLISFEGICNAIALIFACVVIYIVVRQIVRIRHQSEDQQLFTGFAIVTFLVSILLFFALDMVAGRWIMCSTVPLILLFILLEKLPLRKQYLCLVSFYCVIGLLGIREYQAIAADTKNEGLRPVYELIMDSDYSFGYGTFRVGNLMTELTDGKIDMRIVQAYSTNHKLTNRGWLTPIEFEYHDGAFPLILDKERTEGLFEPQEDWKLILDTDEYQVYEIPDQRVFQEYLDKIEL